jgi:hypothetical protein
VLLDQVPGGFASPVGGAHITICIALSSAIRLSGRIIHSRRLAPTCAPLEPSSHRVAIAAFVARFIAAAARGFAGAAACGELIGRDALLFDYKLFGKQCNNGETSARLQHATMSNEAGRAQR